MPRIRHRCRASQHCVLAPMELPLLPLVLVLFASLQLDAARIVAVRGAPPATWATFFAADGTFACDASSVSACVPRPRFTLLARAGRHASPRLTALLLLLLDRARGRSSPRAA
jgi:hypothetical protein